LLIFSMNNKETYITLSLTISIGLVFNVVIYIFPIYLYLRICIMRYVMLNSLQQVIRRVTNFYTRTEPRAQQNTNIRVRTCWHTSMTKGGQGQKPGEDKSITRGGNSKHRWLNLTSSGWWGDLLLLCKITSSWHNSVTSESWRSKFWQSDIGSSCWNGACWYRLGHQSIVKFKAHHWIFV